PAQAGTQCRSTLQSRWIPAFAGMTHLFPIAGRCATRSRTNASLPSESCLPLLEELEPFGRIETGEQIGRHGDRLDRAAELLGEGDARVLAGDVGADRIQLGLLGGDRLPALGQEIIDPELARVRILR